MAQQGGVDAYKAAQKALLNTVKEKSFQDGVSAGKQELLPWLICTGIAAVGVVTYGGYSFVKDKINKKKQAKAQLAKDAEEAERILTETDIPEDIVRKLKKKTRRVDKQNNYNMSFQIFFTIMEEV